MEAIKETIQELITISNRTKKVEAPLQMHTIVEVPEKIVIIISPTIRNNTLNNLMKILATITATNSRILKQRMVDIARLWLIPIQQISNLSNRGIATKHTKILNITVVITTMVITIKEETTSEVSNWSP